jgi:hypothetical protein
MLNENNYELINRYFDGELDKESEILLFTSLSVNEVDRKYFKEMHILKTAVKELDVEYPDSLDFKVLHSIDSLDERRFTKIGGKLHLAISYTVAAVLLLVTLFLFNEVKSYRQSFESISKEVIEQKQTIEMLYNSLPGIVIKSSL